MGKKHGIWYGRRELPFLERLPPKSPPTQVKCILPRGHGIMDRKQLTMLVASYDPPYVAGIQEEEADWLRFGSGQEQLAALWAPNMSCSLIWRSGPGIMQIILALFSRTSPWESMLNPAWVLCTMVMPESNQHHLACIHVSRWSTRFDRPAFYAAISPLFTRGIQTHWWRLDSICRRKPPLQLRIRRLFAANILQNAAGIMQYPCHECLFRN